MKHRFLFGLLAALAMMLPTALNAQVAIPLTQGFEGDDWDADGWVHSDNASQSSEAAKTGSSGLSFYYNDAGYLISPELTGTENGLKVEFAYRAYSPSYAEKFMVGYATDDISDEFSEDDFTWGEEVDVPSTEWASYSVIFPSGVKYVCIRYIYTDAYYLYIDDLQLKEPPSCMPVTNLVASDITTESMTLSWTNESNPSATYTLTYTVDGEEQVVSGLTSTSYEVSGLSAWTTYTFSVVANCSAEEASEAVTLSAKTLCSIASCTIQIEISGGSYNEFSYGGSRLNLKQGEEDLGSYGSSASNSIEVCPVAPIKFFYSRGGNAGWADPTTVAIIDGGGATVYDGDCNTDADEGGLLYVMNTPCPSCFRPTNVVLSDTTTEGISFSWEPGNAETEWIIYLDGEKYDQTTSMEYTVSGLDPNTVHTVDIRSLCTTTDTSSAYTFQFRTACATDPCELTLELGYTGYSNPFTYWSGAASVELMQDGGSLGKWSSNATVEVCGSSPIVAIYHPTGYYTSYGYDSYDASAVIVIKDGGGSEVYNGSWSLDTLVAITTPCPSCLPPTALNLDSTTIGGDEFTFVWTARSGAELFAVYMNDSLVDDAVVDTFYYFGDLTPNTAYKLSVQAICNEWDSSAIVSFVGRTQCPTEMPLPFTEDFESVDNGTFPSCWIRAKASGTDPSVNNVFHASGSQSMFMQTNNGDTNLFVTPLPVPLAGDEIFVRYNAFMNYSTGYYSTANNWIKAGVMTDPEDVSTFIMIDSIANHDFHNTFEEHEFNTKLLDASESYYVAWMFCGYAGYNTYNRGAIDDIYIGFYNGCDRPEMTEVVETRPYEADLRWSTAGGANGYTVYYDTVNVYDPSVNQYVTVSSYADTTVTLTNLKPQTTYFAWIVTNCSLGDANYKAFPYFTTQMSCAPLTGATINHLSYTAAEIGWNYNTEVGFATDGVVISLADNGDSDAEPVEYTAEEGSLNFLFRNLESGHSYTATLRNTCATPVPSVDTASAVTVSFMTSSCSEISSPNHVTDSYYPYYNSQYAYAQNLYLASQMPNIDTIHGVAFNSSSNGPTKTIDVYMANTTIDQLTNSSYVAYSDLVKVASDVVLSAVAGWNAITFDTDFVYDGSSNLVVAIHQKSGGYSSANNWYNIPTEGSQGLEWVKSSSIDITGTLGDASGDNPRMPEIRFMSTCDVPSCFAPMLNIVSTDSSSVVVNWYKIGGESDFYIKYRESNSDAYEMVGKVTDTAYYFTSLDANTPYQFMVGSICGDDTLWSSVNARTACGKLKVPYYNDFENEVVNEAPTCWNVVKTTEYYGSIFPRIEQNGFNGTKNMRFYSSGEAFIATSDVIPLHADSINVSFKGIAGSSQQIEAGFINDLNDLSTFVPVVTVNTGSWEDYEFNTSGLLDATEQYYLAFRFTSSNMYGGSGIDNLTIRKDDGCHRPQNVVAEGDTLSVFAGNVSWTNDGNSLDHILLYKAATATEWDTVYVSDATEKALTGLMSATNYVVRVGTLCPTDTLWANETSFNTGCAPMETPYYENFDSYAEDVLPPCWVLSNPSKITHYDGGLFFRSYNDNAAAVLPLLDADISKLMMTLKVKVGTPAENDGLLIGVANNDGELIEWIDTIQDEYFSRNKYIEYTYNFLNYSGEGTRIALGQLRSWNEWACYDSIVIVTLNDCLPPISVTATNVSNPNHTSFSWNTLDEATAWDVYVDTVGVSIDSVDPENFVTIDDSSYTVPAGVLIGGGKYNFFVRTNCAPFYSDWMKFEFGAGTVVMNNSSTPDTVTGCGMVIYDNGYIAGYKSNSNSALVVYPDAGKELQIYGGIFGWGTDAITLTVYDGVGTSGAVLYQVTNSGTSINYSIDSVLATTTEGAMTITFTSGYSAHTGYELYVRCVDGANCHRPTDVVVTDYSYDNATLAWEGNASEYIVYYRADGSTLWSTATSNEATVTLTGLSDNTQYEVYIDGICAVGDTSFSSHPIFFTTLCAPVDVTEENPFFEDFEGDNLECYTLVYGDENPGVNTMTFSATEKYTGSKSFRFSAMNPTANSNYNEYLITPMLNSEENMTMTVYAKNSSSTSPVRLGYSTSGRDVNNDFVWNDAVTIGESWSKLIATIPANAKFVAVNYAPTASAYYLYIDSLYIAIGSDSSVCFAPTITGTSVATDSIVVNFSADGTVEAGLTTGSVWNASITGTPVSGNSYTFSGLAPNTTYTIGLRTDCGDGNYSVWNTQTITTLSVPCDVPTNVTASDITYTGATVTWNGGSASSWQIRITDGTTTDTVSSNVSTYVFNGLEPATSYNVMVRAECSGETFSDWSATASFTTTVCQTPTNVVTTDVTMNSAKIDWVSSGNKWEVNCNGNIVVVTSKPYVVTGLDEGTEYTVSVRTLCTDAISSEWSDVQYFTTASCVAPTNLVVTDITTTSAKVDWVSTASEWEIDLNGTVTKVNTHPYTLTGLTPNTSYSVQVRALCDATHTSPWSDTKGFSTDKEGIDDVNGSDFNLYPNPASTTVNVDLSAFEGMVTVSIIDLNGRECGKWSSSSESMTIDLGKIASGTYFVRVTGENATAVRKLIVK